MRGQGAAGSVAMESVAVTAALLLCALVGDGAGVGSRGGERRAHDARDYYSKASHKHRPFDPRDFPRFALSGHKGRPDPDPRPDHDPRAVFFIPVKFDFDRGPAPRSLAPERSYDAESPRLIMDKDFNIRFDNPYIVPLTKPLALVLDSRVTARARDGVSDPSEKMMIPFPVLVKARKPLLDSEGFRDYRDHDDVAEHRSVNFDDPPDVPPPAKSPRREAPPARLSKKWKNGTTAKTKYAKKNTLHSLEDEWPRGDSGFKPIELDSYNSSVDSSDIYPGKIFAEMYRNMPAFDSDESREEPRYASTTAKTPRTSSEAVNASWRPRTSKYPGSERLFSASTDLEWVTHANSSKARTPNTALDERESRIVIRDVKQDDYLPETTTARPEDVTISRKFWRTV